ncbi:MAG: PmoA family protein [Planctomycetaceae bacterium]|jgi:hypothetical protein|nr:PmoA family protein [Planctomycetaceae bacterium]
MKKICCAFVVCFVMMFVSVAGGAENAKGTMTSGTYGTAWLTNNRIVRVYDGKSVVEPFTNVKVDTLISADVLGEGSDQLLFIDNAKKSLNIYSFKTKTLSGPFGSNIRTLAAGRFSPSDAAPSLFVCTFAGDVFQWTKDVMDKAWIRISGTFSKVASGSFDPKNKGNFAVISNGNVYTFSTQWQTYSKILEGQNIVNLVAGNFTDAPNDELILINKSKRAFLYQNNNAKDLKQNVSDVAVGKNGDQPDTIYGLDESSNVIVFDRVSGEWSKLKNNVPDPCTGIITQTNPDGKGHQLFVSTHNGFYKIQPEGETINLANLPNPSVVLRDKNTNVPLAEYRYISVKAKPYIDILRTPSGKNILRDSPHDHLHHHGLMFAVAVDGHNFWEENSPNIGRQLTRKIYIKQADGKKTEAAASDNRTSSLESDLDWVNGADKVLIKEKRKVDVQLSDAVNSNAGGKVTLLDWETTLIADDKGAFLDKISHHYYGLGMRFDKSMDKGGRFFSDKSDNKFDVVRGDEKVTECRWLAYTSKLNGEQVTVAVFGHPGNPIPTKGFSMGDSPKGHFAYLGITLNLHRQPVSMKPDSSLTFRYRVVVWDGEATPETVEKTFQQYR